MMTSSGPRPLEMSIPQIVPVLQGLLEELQEARSSIKTVIPAIKATSPQLAVEYASYSVGCCGLSKDINGLLREMNAFLQLPSQNPHKRGSELGASLALISCCVIVESLERLVAFINGRAIPCSVLPGLTRSKDALHVLTSHVPKDPAFSR